MDVRNPNSTDTERPVVKTANEARAGIGGYHVRNVLFLSVGSIVVIFGLLWLFYFGR